ncbi:hypothetical protein Q9L58_006109, partial [Maublancomyces gigas]
QLSQSDVGTPQLTMMNLLYTQKGIEGAVKIWGEFEKWRQEHEAVWDEEGEADQADEGWRMGELGGVEREGRRANGEFEPAIRGYGE